MHLLFNARKMHQQSDVNEGKNFEAEAKEIKIFQRQRHTHQGQHHSKLKTNIRVLEPKP